MSNRRRLMLAGSELVPISTLSENQPTAIEIPPGCSIQVSLLA
jgi:hypothetical protein